MPKTKKEELFFTLMMCTAMLAMMISYNQVMAAGSMKALTFGSWLHEAVIYGACHCGIGVQYHCAACA